MMQPRRRQIWLAAALAAACLLPHTAARAEDCEIELDLLQVELAPGVLVDTLNLVFGTTTEDSLPPLYLLRLPPGGDLEETLAAMLASLLVVTAEAAYLTESPEGTRQMTVAGVGGTIEDYKDQDLAERIGLQEAQAHGQGDGVRVAIIDTGVRVDHPALEGTVLPMGYDFVDDDDDPSDTANGVDDDGDSSVDEGAGHGTMVAGIVHLVAPRAEIAAYRVLDDEARGRTFDVAKAIRLATEQGARVINLSLGLRCESKVIRTEIERAESEGLTVVAAAGNDGAEDPPHYPAADPRVLAVAALDSTDVKAPFSNYGAWIDLSAPGVGILSPFFDGEYALGAGTSFAAPFVAAQAAYVRALAPSLTKLEVDAVLRQGVVDIYGNAGNEPYEGKLGSGRMDLWQTWLETPASASVELTVGGDATQLRLAPNPSRSTEAVTVRLVRSAGQEAGDAGPVFLEILDVAGRRVVHRPWEAASPGAGLRWDGRDEAGRRLPPGLYFLRLAGAASLRAPALVRLP